MRRCIQLALNGKQNTAPNPMVGAVVVHNNQIIGEGYHIQSGGAHAEVNAIQSVKNKNLLQEATLFVSLEPCSHTGKTPPCTDLIIRYKIPQIIIGCQDPFSKVNGSGIRKLQNANIQVEVGILEKECKELIHRFYKFHSLQRPYIILKWAESADHFIDLNRTSGKPMRLSSPFTSLIAHKRRSEVNAILVGTNTAYLDNPSLTTRLWYGKNPIRILIDRKLSLIKEGINLYNGKVQTLVFTEKEIANQVTSYTPITIDFNKNILPQILTKLYQLNIQSVLVEGGATLHQSFIDSNLWDEIIVEHTPLILKDGVPSASLPNTCIPTKSLCMGRLYSRYIND